MEVVVSGVVGGPTSQRLFAYWVACPWYPERLLAPPSLGGILPWCQDHNEGAVVEGRGWLIGNNVDVFFVGGVAVLEMGGGGTARTGGFFFMPFDVLLLLLDLVPVSEDIQVALGQQCLQFAAIWILESHYERGHGA